MKRTHYTTIIWDINKVEKLANVKLKHINGNVNNVYIDDEDKPYILKAGEKIYLPKYGKSPLELAVYMADDVCLDSWIPVLIKPSDGGFWFTDDDGNRHYQKFDNN